MTDVPHESGAAPAIPTIRSSVSAPRLPRVAAALSAARLPVPPLAPAVTALAFAVLFANPAILLVRDWFRDPDAGHGLLLLPIAVWIAWRSRVHPDARANPVLGIATLVFAVLLRFAADRAAEPYTMRMSMVIAAAGLTLYFAGRHQLVRWWLPFTLAALSVPLPAIVLNAIAIPLQLQASEMGAALLEWRHVPVLLLGNVIRIPEHELFVATACSGLRSITALVSLGLILGWGTLRHPLSRLFVLGAALPVAIIVNAVRVFLTAYLMYFVSPELGSGFMHVTEGWLLFLGAFAALAGLTAATGGVERMMTRRAQR